MRYSEACTDAAWLHLVREARDVSIVARFTVDGEPVSKARPRFTRTGRSFTPQKTADAEANMAQAFREAAPEFTPEPDRTYGVTALFFHGTRQRRDVDNCIKLVLDGLNGVAWQDDSQVSEVSGRKVLEEPEHARTEVAIYAVGLAPLATRQCAQCGDHFPVFPGTRRKYCSTPCKAAAQRKARPDCLACGAEVSEQRTKYCSRACAGDARRKPPVRCAQCNAVVARRSTRGLCGDCFRSPDLSTDCRVLRHDSCGGCICACHEDRAGDAA